MIKQVASITVEETFRGEKKYYIPKYQREYTWGIREWDALFYDVTDNENGYFLGSYICVTKGALSGPQFEVIDGQQRFTSLMLLLAALYTKLNAQKEEMDDEEKARLFNLREEIVQKSTSFSSDGSKKNKFFQKLILQKQNMNDEDFSFILCDSEITNEKRKKPQNFGNRRISKAYKHFSKLIDEKCNELLNQNEKLTKIYALFNIVNKFNQAVMVGIEVDTNKDAYMLFESLNHRGVPLSALDLIKNSVISQAESNGDADNSYEIWKQILENIGIDDYSVQERFFRQYYNAFRESLNKPYSTPDKKYYFGYLATRTTILDIYEKMIKRDYNKLLNDLFEKSKTYAVITNNSEENLTYSSALQNLALISGAPSYILLLYIISNQSKLGLSDENIKTAVEILITFFVRRSITDVPSTRRLTQLFIDIISAINSLNGDNVIDEIKKQLKHVSAPDAMFEDKLKGPIYDDNPEATRFLLCSIEAQKQTKEIHTDLWKRDGRNKYVWTIEHIFPEGNNIPDAWIKMIADDNKELAEQYRSEYVHKLGNLTISGYNSNLSNMSFDKKKNREDKDGNKIGYNNGLYLNESVVNDDTWTVEKIENRTESLVKILLDMYKW